MSNNLTIPWVWPEVVVGVWVPQNTTHDMTILQLEVIFEGYSYSEKHDLIQVYVNSTRVSQLQEDHQSYEMTNPEIIMPGWISVRLNIFDSATVSYMASTLVPLISYPVNDSVKEVVVSGSNVTVSCKSGRTSLI